MQIPMDSDGDVRMANAFYTPPPPRPPHGPTQAVHPMSVPPAMRLNKSVAESKDIDEDLFAQQIEAGVDHDMELDDPFYTDPARCLDGVPGIFIQLSDVNTSLPPYKGERVVPAHVLEAIQLMRRCAVRFYMPASSIFRAAYMYAYMTHADGNSIIIARQFPECFNHERFTPVISVDCMLALICLYVVSDQDCLEGGAFDGGVVVNDNQLVPIAGKIYKGGWATRMQTMARDDALCFQPYILSVGYLASFITGLLPGDTGSVATQCRHWITHEAIRIIGLFKWVITGCIHQADALRECGYSRGVWDPAMDCTHPFTQHATLCSPERWARTQCQLMEDIDNPTLMVYYLSMDRLSVSKAFCTRHAYLESPTHLIPPGILFTTGEALRVAHKQIYDKSLRTVTFNKALSTTRSRCCFTACLAS